MYDLLMTSCAFCIARLQEEGVMLTPGSALDMEGWLRIGYCNNTEVLVAGLRKLSAFLVRHIV
jgi:aspartate/methionine/tyrosine aminotransferase